MRRLIVAAAIAAAFASSTSMEPGHTAAPVTGDVAVDASIDRLIKPPASIALPRVPANPHFVLSAVTTRHSQALGFRVNHTAKIGDSGIPADFAGRVALLVQAAAECKVATGRVQRLDCAVKTHDRAVAVMQTPAPRFRDIDLWPTLYIDGDGSDDKYVHDYAVLIDRGGNDTYDNNAGGNLQDIKFGPEGSAAPNKGPAIGCEVVQGNFPAPTAGAHDCIASPQVAFVDYSAFGGRSNDVYGVFKSPRETDHNVPPVGGPRTVDGDCTRDRIVRRIVLQGSGFEGNGLLLDAGGNDTYNGKTAAQGSGHVGGVGVLRDIGAGSDRYLSIRNSQGFALVGVLGLLHDDGGNDRYDTYMPAPKDRRAAFQTNGSGGVVDDTGVCDNLPRMVQGAGLAGGIGVLLEYGGSDVYVGAPSSLQQFNPAVQFFHSSQGFGCTGAIGVLNDVGRGYDRYIEGPPGRRDGASITEASATCAPAAPGVGRFSDDGP